MAGANHEFVGEKNPPNHQNQSDGVETSVTPECSAAHAQATPLDVPPPHQPPQQEDPLVVPQLPQGAPMEVVMAALVNTINRQGQILREQADNMRGQNELIREQNRRLRAVEDSRAASRISSSRPAPRRNVERPLSPPRDNPRKKNHSPPQRNNHNSPPRNKRSPPRRNNRSPPKNGEAAARGGNARHSPRRKSPGSGDERHQGPLSRRIMDIPLPRGLEKPPTLDKYNGTTDPDEHVQSTWWRNLPPGSIDSWEELCRMFTAHFTTSRRHPKTVASLKAIIQGSEESLRSYIERFNKVSVEVEATDKMKLYLLEEGLREETKFQEAVGIVEVQTLDAFFELAQRYIKWEDKQKASEVRRPKNFEKGYARQYIDGQQRTANNAPRQNRLAVDPASPEQHVEEENRVIGGVALAISRPEDFLPLPNNEEKEALDYLAAHLDGSWKNFPGALVISGGDFLPLPNNEEKEALDYLAAHLDGSWKNFPGALVISGGGFNPVTIGSIKRKFDELEKASPVGEIKITEVKENSLPLAFYREEVPGGSPNFQIPLLVRAKMANFDVRRILVDQGSSCDIMYSGLFKVLQLTEENLVPYVGSDLQGFSGSTTKPWGYVDLIVTFGKNKAMKSVKVKFMVVDCPSLYNCIIGRPTLAELFAVSSTIHLKLKYYTKDGQVATINGDIEAARRCFEAASKNLNFVVTPKKKKEETKLPGVNSISIEDGVELDARTSKKERKQEKKAIKDDLLIKENYRLIPDGEFELVPLGENPTKGVKIGADLPDLVNRHIEDGVELDARTSKKERKQEKKAIKDDLLIKENYRLIPDGEFELVPLGENPTKGVKIGADLPDLVNRQLKACLRENAELFALSAAEMPGIDPEVACHQLTIDPRASVIVQRRRKQSPEKAEAARKAVKDLLEANFIAEAQYTTWLSNVVLVKKSNGKWRMCVDYTDLNRACPKDAYPLPNIDKLVDNSSGFKLLSFMDAYSGYNQIKIAEIDKKKTAFMTETGNYYYNVVPFGLKNAGATYQRMMNKVFHNEIGDMLEVYMDDMIVKSEEEIDHTVHLKRVFDQARKFNIRFNPKKCTFGVKAGKFLGFYLTERGIEANPDKCRAFFDYPTPKSKKSIQTLNDMLTSMARFVAKSAQHALPLFKLLRKETTFEWTEECEGALQHLKRALSEPPVLTRPVEGEKLYLYLAVASEAISVVLIRETEQGQKPVYFETLTKPSIEKAVEVMHICAIDDQSWMAPVYNFLKSNTLPADAKEATKIRKRFSISLLKCVEETRVEFILQEIHEWINGQHIGGRSLARKALRAGQRAETLISPWPFAWWGMDILGPFLTAARQVKYLIVAVDYFTKWIEAKPLAKIGASHILRFFKINVLARFGIPQVVVTDNGTQFTNKKFQEFLATIGTTQHFTSVEHPQTNGQAKAANRNHSPHSTTGETPFRLTYGTEAVIPVEMEEPSSRIEYPHEEDINDELLIEELDLVEELRTGTSLREATLKQKIAARHDKRVIKREFEVGSLVLRRNQRDSREGKLAANWEGPYRVQAKTENGVVAVIFGYRVIN
ncbi:hypothetical protein TSUD_396900 [Trifolium subterraneum]|uniref:Integrase catalytic domain-containing protein n=1 Tax=Trifolium subterraneum TaxID=3900 RepID=A0A2Z6N315_TRISU|nr:hypothetical protein TSUD_396900 [Trifolium subterraneum]